MGKPSIVLVRNAILYLGIGNEFWECDALFARSVDEEGTVDVPPLSSHRKAFHTNSDLNSIIKISTKINY